MSLVVTWETTCDGCGFKYSRRKELNVDTEDDHADGITTSYTDIWGYGVPDGWIVVETNNVMLFHSDVCYMDWLRRNRFIKEADDFNNAIWVA